jgi:hypothetical protein
MEGRHTVLMLLVVGSVLTTACLDFGTTPDDTVEGIEVPSTWEPYPVEAGTTVWLFGQEDDVGGPWAFEMDWGSPDNHVSFVVYRETGSCSVPVDDALSPGLPACPVAIGDQSRAKPKRLDWVAEAGTSYVLTARNNGPGDEIVMLREIRFE